MFGELPRSAYVNFREGILGKPPTKSFVSWNVPRETAQSTDHPCCLIASLSSGMKCSHVQRKHIPPPPHPRLNKSRLLIVYHRIISVFSFSFRRMFPPQRNFLSPVTCLMLCRCLPSERHVILFCVCIWDIDLYTYICLDLSLLLSSSCLSHRAMRWFHGGFDDSYL